MSTEWEMEIAQKLEEGERDSGIARIRKLVGKESHPDFDGVHCVECEDDIPPARLQLGKVRCVACQTLLERIKR